MTLPNGWGWPGAARKPHFFCTGEITSLCGRWMYTGSRTRDNDSASKDDCRTCTREAVKLGLIVRGYDV